MPAFQKACYTWLTRYIQLHHDIELSERDIRMLVGGEFFPEDEADGGYESDEDDSRTVVSTEQDQAPAATLRTAQQPPKQDIILELSEDDSVDGSLSSEVSPVCLGTSRNE